MKTQRIIPTDPFKFYCIVTKFDIYSYVVTFELFNSMQTYLLAHKLCPFTPQLAPDSLISVLKVFAI